MSIDSIFMLSAGVLLETEKKIKSNKTFLPKLQFLIHFYGQYVKRIVKTAGRGKCFCLLPASVPLLCKNWNHSFRFHTIPQFEALIFNNFHYKNLAALFQFYTTIYFDGLKGFSLIIFNRSVAMEITMCSLQT